MKKKNSICLLVILISLFASVPWLAPAQSALMLSLDQALEQGLANRPEVQLQLLEQQITDGANAKIKATRNPQLSGSADFRWNTQLQSTVLPFDINGLDPEGSSTVRFGTRFQHTLGIHLDQVILDPVKKVEWKINENRSSEMLHAVSETKVMILQTIAEAYYASLYYQEKARLDRQSLERAQLNLEAGQVQWEQGTLLENERLKLEVALRNAQLTWEKSRDQYTLNLLQLKEQLFLDPNTSIELTDDIASLEDRILNQEQIPPENRPEIQRAQLDEQYAVLQNELALARKKISLNAYGHYGLLQLNDQLNPFGSNTWYPFNYLGLQLAIPVMDGRLARLNSQDQTLRQLQGNLKLKQLQYQLHQDKAQAISKVALAQKTVSMARENMVLAEELYATDQWRFKEGVILPVTLRDSESQLQSAKAGYLDAIYQLLTADLQYKRALGRY